MSESVKCFHRFAIVDGGLWKFCLHSINDGQSMGNFNRFFIVVLFRYFCESWCRRWRFSIVFASFAVSLFGSPGGKCNDVRTMKHFHRFLIVGC